MRRLRMLASASVALALACCKTGPDRGAVVLEDGAESGDDIQFDGPAGGAHPAAPEAEGGLKYSEYDVRFTNPVCADYKYDSPVQSVGGEYLVEKPKNVFCTEADAEASANRPEAPQAKLLSWINDPATKEIFFAYLSFSNKAVKDALCKAIKQRNVKVQFVMDSTSDADLAQELLACVPGNGAAAPKPKMFLRGHQGGIGYAHNKVFFVNPGAATTKIAFSSGNMTAGIVLHHENWHFITLPGATYFAQAHVCLMNGMIDHGASLGKYTQYMAQCRGAIPYKQERDVRAFFIPGDGAVATTYLQNAIKKASQIRVAAHRFGYNKLIDALAAELKSAHPAKLQMVHEDDMYWAGQGEQTGDNEAWEYDFVVDLADAGASVKWMETNHAEHLLHHNKYLIFNMPPGSAQKPAVFGGAGNLTGTGFTSNFETFYYVEIPAVVAAYNKQYDHVWNDLATTPDRMPAENVLPPGAEYETSLVH